MEDEAAGRLGIVPRVLAAQASVGEQASRTPDDNLPRRLSVHVAAGATLPHGDASRGTIQSVSIGYAPTPKLMVLVSGGRIHSLGPDCAAARL